MSDDKQPEDTALGTQSAALEVGLRVFRQYVLKRFLSRGAIGSAWLVVHEGIGRELAMRFLPESWLHDEPVIARLREAVVRLLEITHPGLVGILDFVRDPQAAAIVSRYVEGESALDAKAQRPQRCFEIETIRPWLAQMCDALDFAWRRHHAFHGDLCPANLLITPLGDLKVSDFGLARCLFGMESPSGGPLLVLPPSYASPERLRGEPATVADDVYGFGATVYDLITSKPAFYRGEPNDVVPPTMAQRRAELGIGGDLIPPEWEEVVAACLAPRAEDRPRSLREAGERLHVLAPLPADADRTPQPTVLPRPHETVVDYQPPSTRPAETLPIYPTSEVTAAMEPPTMSAVVSSPAPAAEPPQPVEPEPEAAPATIDESLDFEGTVEVASAPPSAAPSELPAEDDSFATIAAVPPPVAPSPFVPPPPSHPVPTDDDASATIAADPTPPPPAKPPPVADDDLEMTVAEVLPSPAPAPAVAQLKSEPISPPVPPVKPPEIPRNLEESVTMPTPVRAAAAAAAALERPPEVPASVPSPAVRRPPVVWIALGAVVLCLAIAAPIALRKGPAEPTPQPGENPSPVLTPQSESTPPPATPTPIPATPVSTPTPVPTTPQPAGRTIDPPALIASALNGRVAEPLLLAGSFRVSTVTPPLRGQPASIVMRPADPELTGKMRILVRLAPSPNLPGEGSTLTLDASARIFVREVRQGADGQVNVDAEQVR